MMPPVERLRSSSLSSMSPFLAVLVSASLTAALCCCVVVSVFLSVLMAFSYWLCHSSRQFVGPWPPGVHGKAGYLVGNRTFSDCHHSGAASCGVRLALR